MMSLSFNVSNLTYYISSDGFCEFNIIENDLIEYFYFMSFNFLDDTLYAYDYEN